MSDMQERLMALLSPAERRHFIKLMHRVIDANNFDLKSRASRKATVWR
jgi:hypothetical protein